MSEDINVWVGTGRLTKDAEFKNVGQSVLMTGSIACNKTIKKDNEYIDSASFFEFKKFLSSEKQANFFKDKTKKGAKVTINGELEQQSWTDSSGQKHSKVVINVDKLDSYAKGGNGSDDSFPSE